MQIHIVATLASLAIRALAALVEESQMISYDRALLLSREFQVIAPRLQEDSSYKRSPCMDECFDNWDDSAALGCTFAPGCQGIAWLGQYVSTLMS